MTDENFSMKRSRTQLATVYAPGAFFTFEGGMGACIAHPAARERADLTQMLKNQILETINERVRSWYQQGMNCRRSQGQPPIDPELILDPQLRRDPNSPRLPAEHLEFLVPEVMNYSPEPLTFVCRKCGLLKDFRNVTDFENNQDALSEGCPHILKNEPCNPNWEQLDVVLVHWSGGYHRIAPSSNKWDRDAQDVIWRRKRCHCGNQHFLLDRSSPVFNKWRLICSACRSGIELPVLMDETSLRVLGDGIDQGRNQRVEVNMEPVSYRANSAYYVQGDRVLAFANEEYFPLLHGRNEDLCNFLAKEYAYPIKEISEAEIENILREKNRTADWLTYKQHLEIATIMKNTGREDLAATSLKAQQDHLERWRKEGLIPDVYEHTRELRAAVLAGAAFWDRKFDPIRQAIEHKTLEVDVLNDGSKVINVREPKDPVLPDMTAEEVERAKAKICDQLSLLGIEDFRLIRKFPVCEFTFGYSRVESGPRVAREKSPGVRWEMPVRLNLFARAYFHEQHVQPVYVMKQDNEAFYVRLRQACVRNWLDTNQITYQPPAADSRLGAAMVDMYDAINPDGRGFSSWLDEYRCQSAFKFDPRSAPNFDPLERRVRAVAVAPSELVGVAETARARFGV